MTFGFAEEISILQSAIKSVELLKQFDEANKFQFYRVRLKDP
ncbi:MAG: hypothetical protein H6Q14_1237 [Bacteroidetes bacterium]|nr:hypothetical protein [Bacteroidota bacterium]